MGRPRHFKISYSLLPYSLLIASVLGALIYWSKPHTQVVDRFAKIG